MIHSVILFLVGHQEYQSKAFQDENDVYLKLRELWVCEISNLFSIMALVLSVIDLSNLLGSRVQLGGSSGTYICLSQKQGDILDKGGKKKIINVIVNNSNI